MKTYISSIFESLFSVSKKNVFSHFLYVYLSSFSSQEKWFSVIHILHCITKWWLSGKESSAMQEMQVRSLGWEDFLRRKWQSTLVFLTGKAHGQRTLAGYSPQGYKRAGHDLAIQQQHSLYGLALSLAHKLHAIIFFKCTSNRNFIQFKHKMNFIRNIPRHFIEFEQFE